MSNRTENWLLKAMQNPSCYDHPVAQIELIETHISWIFLAGEFAYKVKKPVNFGFLNFSTLAKRRHYCQEELRLNRRFAPQLYLAVKSIGGEPNSLTLGGQPALEYAVKMQRFEQTVQLDRMLEAGRLNRGQLEQFATMIAKTHQTAAVAANAVVFGSPAAVCAPIEENFRQIRPLLPKSALRQLNGVEQWSRTELEQLHSMLLQRKRAGFIRECHGDIHLANMAWVDEQPLLFDCIEFNEDLRWIDVVSDIAFLLMDLDDRGESILGWRFLNRYLQESGDYQGLQLLRGYKVYRAMVRAKVLCLRLQQPGLGVAERAQDLARYHSYLELAASYTAKPARALIITHGLSASGKTSIARELADHCGAIHLQSDRERKRLHGLAATADSHSPLAGGIYSAQADTETYIRLQLLAEQVLAAGYPVLVDATCLQQWQRNLFHQLAERFAVPQIILDFAVSEAELRRRIKQRATAEHDISEANLAVLGQQLTRQQPLNQAEQKLTIAVGPETSATEIATQLVAQINNNTH
jgi:aminoglycoside phosphotransferase family enzyme/predicted kinase